MLLSHKVRKPWAQGNIQFRHPTLSSTRITLNQEYNNTHKPLRKQLAHYRKFKSQIPSSWQKCIIPDFMTYTNKKALKPTWAQGFSANSFVLLFYSIFFVKLSFVAERKLVKVIFVFNGGKFKIFARSIYAWGTFIGVTALYGNLPWSKTSGSLIASIIQAAERLFPVVFSSKYCI